MKKFLSFILAIVCLLVVAGCGSAGKKAEVRAQKQTGTEKVLRVGTNADYPPFEYYQEASKSYTGFDIELMQAVAKEMGYANVEFVNLEFNNLLPSLKDGQVDVVISCMTITEDRKQVADFTEPYLDSTNVAVAAFDTEFRSVGAMKDRRIAVEVGSVHVKEAKKYTNYVIECGDAEEALQLLLAKKADFAVLDNYTARFYISHNYNSKLTIMTEMHDATDTGIAIAVPKGNKEMLDKLNAGLRNYRKTVAFDQLKQTYFGRLK